jgi:hypothetical protein
VGLLAGLHKHHEAQEQAAQHAQAQCQQAQQYTQQQMADFKKAFGLCLQAKGYMVSY